MNIWMSNFPDSFYAELLQNATFGRPVISNFDLKNYYY